MSLRHMRWGLILGFAIHIAQAMSAEQKLGEVSSQIGTRKVTLELFHVTENALDKNLPVASLPVRALPVLQLKSLGFNPPIPTMTLSTRGLCESEKLKVTEPLRIREIQLDTKTSAWWIQIALIEHDAKQEILRERSVAVVLLKELRGWKVIGEWSADCKTQAAGASLKESLSIAAPKIGTIQRQFRSLSVESIPFTLECGCGACASKTLEYLENETWIWNADTQTLNSIFFEKSYLLQPSEGLLSVARKALGDMQMIGRIYKLNPTITPDSPLKEGQAIVVDRRIAKK